ncbi:MAG: class I SAM-dependent methyltransferase [Anaerolineae bacterium]|nr:class I SAM-dependent methyltransferase [Anaerolineae bacterium]
MTHDDLAALRGVPSLVWRAGQERRLQMIARWVTLDNAVVLEHGCGVGMYSAQIRQRYTPHVEAFDIEAERVQEARAATPHALVAAAEMLPYRSNSFDTIITQDVLEHVADDQRSAQEIVRVLKPGGRAFILVPNRWYPFETHGHYWRGQYHFGNTPLINYLPDSLRNRLAPHVRAYTAQELQRLFKQPSVRVITQHRIYGGYDNLVARFGAAGRALRTTLQALEGSFLDTWGLAHVLVIEKG